jgi:radical SAM superfamily enzyme
MKISLSTSLHLDHGTISLDQRPGDNPPMQSFVPVGLLSLKAAVDRANVDVQTRVIELNGLINAGKIPNDDRFYDNITDAIFEDGDEFVGLMTDADSLAHTILTAHRVKQRSPETFVCLGGPAASPMGRLLLERFPFIDFVARGEAEITLVELLRELRQGRKPEKVLGLTWRNGDEVVVNCERPVIENVDDLPVPAFDSYDMAAGAPLYLDVGRGCPFKCRFCATAPFWDRRYRMKTTDRIIQEMALIRDQYGRNHVNFSHDIFTCDNKWTLAFCERLISERLGVTWSCSTRTDIIDPDTLMLMADAGCVEIYYGIESGSDSTQKFIDKGLDLAWSREIVRATAAAGIRPVTGFIVGHPNENRETLRDTLDKFFDFLQVGKHRAHFFTLCPFPEAPMYQQYKDTITRPAQYAEIALTDLVTSEFEQLKESNGDIFSSMFRFATPNVSTRLIDASEEISCHLVVLKSIWPLLIPHYESTLDWYERWVNWIETYNLKYRPGTALLHQGNAYDLLLFIKDELARLGLADSDVAELARYEETKLDARYLEDPKPRENDAGDLSISTVIMRRCNYLAERFHYDIQALLSGAHASRIADNFESWVIFAKTNQSYIDTLQTKGPIKYLLERVDQPRPVDQLLSDLRSTAQIEDEQGFHLIRQLYDRGLLCEVMS